MRRFSRDCGIWSSCGPRASCPCNVHLLKCRARRPFDSIVPTLSTESKWFAYVALNVVFCVVLLVGAAAGGGSLARLPYVAIMFALCSSPIPFIDRLNGSYAILGVAMMIYFMEFALLDAAHMFSPPKAVEPGGLIPGEGLLIIGAFVKILGFHVAVRLWNTRNHAQTPEDWPPRLLIPAGMLLWVAGCAATMYQSLVLVVDNTDATTTAGFTKLGVWGTSGMLLIGNYAGPLGIIIMAYWWTVWSRRAGTALVLFVIFAQFVVGFLVDQKETALNAAVVMLLTRFIIQGKVPIRWLAGCVIGIALVFPVLTAKRLIMTEGLHLTRAQAVSRTLEILERAIAERNVAREGKKYEQSSQTFLERVTDKGAVELFAAHVGVDQPYKMGSTLEQLLYIFAPRVIWSEKPGGNSAQTFNRDFHLSEDPDTHISPTHIGELYWNFGLAGVIAGMALLGALLGYVTSKFNSSEGTSLTRVLVIMVTLYEIVLRGGGQIEIEYVVWGRTLVLIGILHLLLARPSAGRQVLTSAPSDGLTTGSPAPALVRFPNLLR